MGKQLQDARAQAIEELVTAAQTVHDTFVADEEQGYSSRDRRYAIEMLGKFLPDAVAAIRDLGKGG